MEYVEYFAETPFGLKLRENFDLVGFDPRGVGHSTQVHGVDDPVPYTAIVAPETVSEYVQLTTTVQDYAAQCTEKSGSLLEHVSTMDVVRDMELIRRTLGEGKLNDIGLSYGTKIGAPYADEYPEEVRAMVLDGVPPLRSQSWG